MNRVKLFYHLFDKVYDLNFWKSKKLIEKYQTWNEEKIKNYQFVKMKMILKHASENVPFYIDYFKKNNLTLKDFKSLDDLKLLPIIRRKDLDENRDMFVAINYKKYPHFHNKTSGTTGMALHYYVDKKLWGLLKALHFTNIEWAGYQWGDPMAIMAVVSSSLDSKIKLKKKLWLKTQNITPLQIMHLSDEIINSYIEIIKKNKIKFLRGYPTAVYSFAQALKKKNINIKLKSVMTTGEILYDFQREFIEKIFDTKIFNAYGAHDGGMSTAECEAHQGLHIHEIASYMEIVDKNGNPLKDGEGEVVSTCLHNYSMPFIRYSPEDFATVTSKKCTCGRESRILTHVNGRSSDVFYLSNGRTFNGLSMPIEDFKVSRFQIVQTKEDCVEVNLLPLESNNEEQNEIERKKINDLIAYHCGDGIKVITKYEDNFVLSSAGKFRYVINAIKKEKS